MQPFELSEIEPRPGCRDIKVHGELDLAVAGQLDEALTGAVEAADVVLVDMGRCEFIDSSGLAVILRAHRRMEELGKRLAIYAPNAQVERILAMTGLTTNGLVFETAEEAAAAAYGEQQQS